MATKPKPCITAIIVAAGSGKRMGGIDKPLIRLGGQTVIERVVGVFTECPSVNSVTVVCRADDREQYSSLLARFAAIKPIVFAEGGATRSDSVLNGVNASRNADYVCIHDCARPFITSACVESVISAAVVSGAACACTKMRDTVKYSSEEEHCFYTPKRENLIAVQTPQVFKKDLYLVAHTVAKNDGFSSTDETTLAEHAGFTVSYVECSSLNIKLTDPNDVKIAKAICFLEANGDISREKDLPS